MSGKLWSFRYTCLVIFLCCTASVKGQHIDYIKSLQKDTVSIVQQGDPDKRIHIRYKGINRIIPTIAIGQFAGNMGLVSVGAGWDHGARAQWETALMAGIIPKEEGKKSYVTVTLKETFTPWSIQMSNRWSFEPLTCALYFNSIISRDFWVREPEHYPKSYYGFSTKIRANISIGESITFYTRREKGSLLRYTSLFYEFGTADMYIISKATNKYLKFWDIFGISFGVKMKLI